MMRFLILLIGIQLLLGCFLGGSEGQDKGVQFESDINELSSFNESSLLILDNEHNIYKVEEGLVTLEHESDAIIKRPLYIKSKVYWLEGYPCPVLTTSEPNSLTEKLAEIGCLVDVFHFNNKLILQTISQDLHLIDLETEESELILEDYHSVYIYANHEYLIAAVDQEIKYIDPSILIIKNDVKKVTLEGHVNFLQLRVSDDCMSFVSYIDDVLHAHYYDLTTDLYDTYSIPRGFPLVGCTVDTKYYIGHGENEGEFTYVYNAETGNLTDSVEGRYIGTLNNSSFFLVERSTTEMIQLKDGALHKISSSVLYNYPTQHAVFNKSSFFWIKDKGNYYQIHQGDI